MIKLFLSDLDGTLLDANMQIADRDLLAIEELKNHKIHFGIVTGRDRGVFTRCIAPRFSFGMDFIGNNGGTITVDDKEPSLLKEIAMDPKEVHRMMVYVKKHLVDEACPFVADDEANFYYLQDVPEAVYWKTGQTFMNQIGTVAKQDLLDYLVDPIAGVVKVSFYTKAEDPSHVTNILREQFGELFEFSQTSKHFVEATSKGIDKGTAIATLLAYHGIQPDEVAIIGDGENDIPMFTMYKHAYVMDSAPTYIQSYGTVVSSVAQAIAYVLKGNEDEEISRI